MTTDSKLDNQSTDTFPNDTIALAIGESLIDLVKTLGNDDAPTAHPGGSPFNVAVTLGRLGRPVELCTWFADDAYGKLITDHLRESNVTISSAANNAQCTSTALATLDASGSAAYEFQIDWQIPASFKVPANAGFVHTGSIGAVNGTGGQRTLELFSSAKQNALLTYDPNIRPTVMPAVEETRPLVESYVSSADLVKVSDEDLEWLYPNQPLEKVIDGWFALGETALIIITGGEKGPQAWTKQGVHVFRKPKPVVVKDTVGAGDSFMGALIDSLWKRGLAFRSGARQLAALPQATVEELLDEANAVAGITVSRAGANPPWAKELSR